MKLKKSISFILAVAVVLTAVLIPVASADNFDAVLKQFPSSYRAGLKALHAAHPNWTFKRLTVGIDFNTAIDAEHNCRRQLCTVQNVSATDPKACSSSCKNAAFHVLSSVDRCASRDYIAECMDPVNYLNDSDIFQFEYLTNKSYYTVADIQKVLKDKSSFMANLSYTNSSGVTASYAKIILAAAKKYNVDALFIVSRITKEVGASNPSSIALGKYKGYEGYYNFFNIGGTVAGSAKYAKNQNWKTPYLAMMGGVEFISKYYISSSKKDQSPWQYTSYLQKFQVHPYSMYQAYDHQYMQTVDGVIAESSYTYSSYSKLGYLDKTHTFVIPVYNNMDKVSYSSSTLHFDSLGTSSNIGYVNSSASNLNIRSSASTSSSVVTTVPSGTIVLTGTRKNGWVYLKIISGSKMKTYGWAMAAYIDMCAGVSLKVGSKITLKPKTSDKVKYTSVKTTGAGVVSVSGNTLTGKTAGTVVLKATSSKGATSYICAVVSKAAAAVKKGTVTASSLNVRKSASTSAKVLAVIKKNQSVNILGTSGSWYKISVSVNKKTITGYVSKSYIKTTSSSSSSSSSSSASSAKKGKVNTANLNMRKSASSNASILTVLKSGKLVNILGTSGNWYKISVSVNNKTLTGYVNKKYITVLSYGKVYDASSLNIRKSASTGSAVLVKIPSGTKVLLYSSTGNWYRVIFTYKGKSYNGFASKDYIKKV